MLLFREMITVANAYCHEKYCNVSEEEKDHITVEKSSQNSVFLGWLYMAAVLAGAILLDNLLL